MTDKAKPTGLDLMRQPFAPNQIGKLPKESKKQREEREANRAFGINCPVCKGWHHKNAVHLDYVGHAATTDRLLDSDINWNWEPIAWAEDGPKFDNIGGLWIRLTVCGVTRLGYGNADKKMGADMGSREKEVIGDAIRNAAMRFGSGLEMWHKGDLHGPNGPEPRDDDDGAGSPLDGHPTDVRERQDAAPPPPENTSEALPAFDKKVFEKDFPAWKEAIESGKRTKTQVFAMLNSKGVLNPVQKAKIDAIRAPA